ncbi:MAG TPA: branched-chain amino acid ABC transporter permease [Burkholderiales bacterium]|jgi:branched-chain amino acid transport system permease protein|nr:branched-chain amino acid ABC transporter permease [Burkholderiales bacterium]
MKRIIVIAVLACAFPWVMQALDQHFYTSFAARILIYAMAAASLNLVLGYGGMVSFGHAAFFGAGAYIVGILAVEGVSSLWISWPLAIAVAALAALVIGAISLRTRGVYFIMITLAFAQMMYYVFVSLKAYGGDDGVSLPGRSTGLGVSLSNDIVWYYLVLAELAGVLYLLHRLLHSRFGRVIEAIRENETRATAVGYPVYRYKLLCFVISGAIAGLAGALIANQTSYVGPALLHWVQSGTLMIMVILGGVARFWGGPVGAVVLLALEELFSGSPLLGPYSLHWQLPVGAILLAVVLFAPQGIAGAFAKKPQ